MHWRYCSNGKGPEYVQNIADEIQAGNKLSALRKSFSIQLIEITLKRFQYLFRAEPAQKFIGPPRWLSVVEARWLSVVEAWWLNVIAHC